jgi:hypothetical protein
LCPQSHLRLQVFALLEASELLVFFIAQSEVLAFACHTPS